MATSSKPFLLTGNETMTLYRLVVNARRKDERDYAKPKSIATREAYFARPENAGRADMGKRRIEYLLDLEARLKEHRRLFPEDERVNPGEFPRRQPK